MITLNHWIIVYNISFKSGFPSLLKYVPFELRGLFTASALEKPISIFLQGEKPGFSRVFSSFDRILIIFLKKDHDNQRRLPTRLRVRSTRRERRAKRCQCKQVGNPIETNENLGLITQECMLLVSKTYC